MEVDGVNMEERKPMYEFDLGFMGKVICSADTAASIQGLIILARCEAYSDNMTLLVDAYHEIFTSISDTLKSVGYYNEIL